MRQGSEALQQLDFNEESEPIKKKGADIIPFRQKPRDNSEKEIGNDYDKYMASGGILSQKEYQYILKLADEGTHAGSRSSYTMPRPEGIIISPEAETIYGILNNERSNLVKAREEMGDKYLLGEAFLIVGDKSSRDALVKKYPHIFN